MLRPPHSTYNRLYVYYFDRKELPPIDDPDLIGTWIEDDNALLFFHSDRRDLVREICGRTGASLIYEAELDYRDWEAGVEITSFDTRTLTVRPVWEKDGDRPSRREIILDPSVIFGSGFHATTRLCLETLEMVLLESGRRIRSMVDLGTGTGLLAIAAARLGVEQVVAIDNNPFACEVARRNVSLNGCKDRVQVHRMDLMAELPDTGCDLVVTNLYKGLLVRLFEDPAFWRGSMYLVSGFIAGMEADLLAALPADTTQMLHRGSREQWRLWLLQHRAAGQER
ncbi:50S ribosomal protein L11 methyltransferase [Desulfolithobacter sp.]